MIFTDRTITVRKGESRIDEPIVVYRGDYELEVRFTILNSRFKFMSGTNMIESEKASYGQLAILTPYGGNIFSDIVRCNDGSVTFVLTAEMLNQIEEVGLYSFQIRLMDYTKESRVSIPPIEFGIEVREPIASEDHDNSVNNAIVGYSIAKVVDGLNEYVPDTFDDDDNYNKTEWETGDRITEGKLNKIEDALDKINKNELKDKNELNRRITSNFNILTSEIDRVSIELTDINQIQEKKIYQFDCLDTMKRYNLKCGEVCNTLGYYSKNDGGNATYLIREKTIGDVEDNYNVVGISNGLVAEKIKMSDTSTNNLYWGITRAGNNSSNYNLLLSNGKCVYKIKDLTGVMEYKDYFSCFELNNHFYLLTEKGYFVSNNFNDWEFKYYNISNPIDESLGIYGGCCITKINNDYKAFFCIKYKDGSMTNLYNGSSNYFKPVMYDVSVNGFELSFYNPVTLNYGLDNESSIDPYVTQHNGVIYLAIKNEYSLKIELYSGTDINNLNRVYFESPHGIEAPKLIKTSNGISCIGVMYATGSINNLTSLSYFALKKDIVINDKYVETSKWEIFKSDDNIRHIGLCEFSELSYDLLKKHINANPLVYTFGELKSNNINVSIATEFENTYGIYTIDGVTYNVHNTADITLNVDNAIKGTSKIIKTVDNNNVLKFDFLSPKIVNTSKNQIIEISNGYGKKSTPSIKCNNKYSYKIKVKNSSNTELFNMYLDDNNNAYFDRPQISFSNGVANTTILKIEGDLPKFISMYINCMYLENDSLEFKTVCMRLNNDDIKLFLPANNLNAGVLRFSNTLSPYKE